MGERVPEHVRIGSYQWRGQYDEELEAHVVIAAGVLAMASILGGVLTKPVWAQVRAALVSDVDDAKQPVQRVASAALLTGSAEASATIYTVPPGKRLVIENVAVRDATGIRAGKHRDLGIGTTVGGTTAFHVPRC